jgi:hypothetical protein
MRTLKLTHEEISMIQHALGVAERVFADQYKSAVEMINVRGNDESHNQRRDIKALQEMSFKFADLNYEIGNSEKDV